MKGHILVTGGTGFIGSHTVVCLLESGYLVTIADSLENSYAEVVDSIEKITGIRPGFVKVNLADAEACAAIFTRLPKIDSVIHFAAYKAVGESVEQPLRYYRNNLSSLINIAEQMEVHGIKNIVFSSSATVYGEPDELPVTEQSPTRRPQSPYGNTKKMAEEILEDTAHTGVLQAISLRYFNPAGAHPSALIGELPIGQPNNLIPVITQAAIGKRNGFTVYGDDYDTPDGTCIRDYIHITDLARAHVVAVERQLTNQCKASFEIFNLGTGRGYSVLEVIRTFERVNGLKLNYTIGGRRAGDITQIYADTSLANRELGWKATESLESMVGSAWQWEKNIPLLFPGL